MKLSLKTRFWKELKTEKDPAKKKFLAIYTQIKIIEKKYQYNLVLFEILIWKDKFEEKKFHSHAHIAILKII